MHATAGVPLLLPLASPSPCSTPRSLVCARPAPGALPVQCQGAPREGPRRQHGGQVRFLPSTAAWQTPGARARRHRPPWTARPAALRFMHSAGGAGPCFLGCVLAPSASSHASLPAPPAPPAAAWWCLPTAAHPSLTPLAAAAPRAGTGRRWAGGRAGGPSSSGGKASVPARLQRRLPRAPVRPSALPPRHSSRILLPPQGLPAADQDKLRLANEKAFDPTPGVAQFAITRVRRGGGGGLAAPKYVHAAGPACHAAGTSAPQLVGPASAAAPAGASWTAASHGCCPMHPAV